MKHVIASAALMLVGLVPTAEAQLQVAPNMFPTMEACREALASGHVRFYEPRYLGLASRNPINNIDRIVVPLEADVCLEMLVVGGRQFVAQREGTLFRAQRLADGSLSLYARNDCGNPVYGMAYPPPQPAPRNFIVLGQEQVERLPEPPPPARPVMVPFVPEKSGGFCSSKKCRWTLAIVGASAAGYAAWRLWPCPPGTVRK